jgi:hypothetical protein
MKKYFWKFMFWITGTLLTYGLDLCRIRKAYKLSIRRLCGKELPVRQSNAYIQAGYDEFFGIAYPFEKSLPVTKAECDTRLLLEKETGKWPVFLPYSA